MLFNILIEKDILIVKISHFSLEDIHDIVEKVEGSEVKKVLLEIQESTIVSSSTLAFLGMINRNLKKLNIKLGVANMTTENKRMMKWAGLDKTLCIFDDINQGKEKMTIH